MPSLKIIPTKKILSLVFVALLLSIALAFFRQSVALSQQPVGAEILVRDRGSITSNQITMERIQYIGQCANTVHLPANFTGQFLSPTTPPAPGRRALLRNVTKGLDGNPFPFTDREYHAGGGSEGFSLSLGYEHSQRDFRIVHGTNQIEYEIKEGNGSVIERGNLALQVVVNDRGSIPRNVICSEQWKCTDDSPPSQYPRQSHQPNPQQPHHPTPTTPRVCYPFNVCSCPSDRT